MEGIGVGEIIPGAAAPVFYQPVRHGSDGQVAAVIGAEVPGAGIVLRIPPEGGAEMEVAAEGFQNMLPGPDGAGAADADGLPCAEGADTVGNEAIFAPVATTDDVASPG